MNPIQFGETIAQDIWPILVLSLIATVFLIRDIWRLLK